MIYVLFYEYCPKFSTYLYGLLVCSDKIDILILTDRFGKIIFTE